MTIYKEGSFWWAVNNLKSLATELAYIKANGLLSTGPAGPSPYQLAVTNGFVGTEPEWLASLIGPEGPVGPPSSSALVNVLDYAGVDPTGATDSTAGFALALADSNTVYVPKGTYIVNELPIRSGSIVGASAKDVTMKPSTGGYCLRLGYTQPHWTQRVISNITFDGLVRTKGAMYLEDTTSTETSGRWKIDNCYFFECDKAFWKPTGDIGNHLIHCTFEGCNYGYYAEGDVEPFMQAGFDTLELCNWFGTKLAGIYIDSSTPGTGGTHLIRPHFEVNPGFCIFIKNYKTGYTPLMIDGFWTEVNGTTGGVVNNITINGTTYPACDLYLENCDNATVINSAVEKVKIVNSVVNFDNCLTTYGSTVIERDSTSIVRVTNHSPDGDKFPGVVISSLKRVPRYFSNQAMAVVCPHRMAVVPNKTFLYSQSFSGGAITLSGSNAIVGVLQNNVGPTFANANRYTIPAGNQIITPGVTLAVNKFYVLTACLRKITATQVPKMYWGGTGPVANNLHALLQDNKFVTVATVGQPDPAGSAITSTSLWFDTTGMTGDSIIDVQAVQFVEFDTFEEALNFFNERLF